VRFESTFNFSASLHGLGMDDLFAPTSADTSDIIAAIRAAPEVVDQLAFLAYESEFLAGGWRFLTYFGRDTLLAMQVLLPVLSPRACEGILAGVISRTGPDGKLCHEETIGEYAAILNAAAGHPERGTEPVYDYKMVDTDFLLLPALAAYAAKYPARAKALMARESTLVPGTFGHLVRRNADRVLRLARPFAEHPTKTNLISLKAWPFGNWRDSAAGNGWGHYPFDVNCASEPDSANPRRDGSRRPPGHLSAQRDPPPVSRGGSMGQHMGDGGVRALRPPHLVCGGRVPRARIRQGRKPHLGPPVRRGQPQRVHLPGMERRHSRR
jgi:hypothetical protein